LVAMRTTVRVKALILVPLAVFTVLLAFFALGYLVTLAFKIPLRFNFPLPVRLIGVLVLLSGFLFLSWFFRDRMPVDVLVSTYVSLSKVARGVRLEERSGRTERLVVKGPYRYVRHPLYLGVLWLLLGWWLLFDFSFLLLSTVLLLLWFNFVVAPFEEKELRAMFGEEYERYAKGVPKIIPFTTRRKK
jgi:protein-S-isoprenylcysteine O-methyltransferase Ste14